MTFYIFYLTIIGGSSSVKRCRLLIGRYLLCLFAIMLKMNIYNGKYGSHFSWGLLQKLYGDPHLQYAPVIESPYTFHFQFVSSHSPSGNPKIQFVTPNQQLRLNCNVRLTFSVASNLEVSRTFLPTKKSPEKFRGLIIKLIL